MLAGCGACPSKQGSSSLFQPSHKAPVKAVPNMGQKAQITLRWFLGVPHSYVPENDKSNKTVWSCSPCAIVLRVSSKLGHSGGARVLSGPTRTQPSSSSRLGLFCKAEEVWFNPLFRSKNGDLDASDKMSNEKYHKVTSKNSLFHLKFKPRTGSKNAVFLKTTNFKAGKKTVGLTGMSAFTWHEKNVAKTWFISLKKRRHYQQNYLF